MRLLTKLIECIFKAFDVADAFLFRLFFGRTCKNEDFITGNATMSSDFKRSVLEMRTRLRTNGLSCEDMRSKVVVFASRKIIDKEFVGLPDSKMLLGFRYELDPSYGPDELAWRFEAVPPKTQLANVAAHETAIIKRILEGEEDGST